MRNRAARIGHHFFASESFVVMTSEAVKHDMMHSRPCVHEGFNALPLGILLEESLCTGCF